MGKKERARRMKAAGLHEIKNKYRARAVNKKRKGLVLSAKKKWRTLKACASASAIFLGLMGLFAIGNSFFKPGEYNNVPDDFVTVSYALPTDGTTPAEHEGLEGALENIGYMNYRFQHQPNWYSETHGVTDTAAGPQSVNTIKQYSDDVLIMVDIARSNIIKAGRQFCYIGNEVMWRNVVDSSNYMMDNYEQMLALKWKNELEKHTTIEAFKKKNGLPGTEFSVYIINEETLYYASKVEQVKSTYAASQWDADYIDGNVYRQTYYLRAGTSERLGAAAHYSNQIVFTGGLQSVSFQPLPSSLVPGTAYEGTDLVGEKKVKDEPLIKVTYTFDSKWQVLHAEIDEAYGASMGIFKGLSCTSKFATDYEYGTDRTKNPAYEDFFKDFVGKDVEDSLDQPLSSLGLIMDAFLSGPVTYELDLNINGKKTNGLIALDAAKLGPALDGGGGLDALTIIGGLGVKAKIGDIYIYLENSTAYLAVGDLKVQLPIEKLMTLIQGETNDEPDNKDAELLSTETKEGETTTGGTTGSAPSIFTIKDPVVNADATQATVLAVLDLSSLDIELEIPLNFTFNLDANKKASLAICTTSISYQGIEANIAIKGTEKSLSDLTDKDSFVDLYDYAEAVYNLVMDKKLNITLDYANDKMALDGNIGIDFTGELLVAGQLTLSVGEQSKTVGIIVKEGVAYLNLDGIKLSVSIDEAIDLVQGYLTSEDSDKQSGGIADILNRVLTAVFDNDLAALISIEDKNDVLAIGLKGTELLKAFGLDFALGDVQLTVGKSGTIAASAYGANLTVEASDEALAADTTGYIDVMPYVNTILNMIESGSLTADVRYEKELGADTLIVEGKVVIARSPLALSGEVTVKYGNLCKTLEFVYDKDGYLYFTLDALKAKANPEDVIALISSMITSESGDASEEEESDIYAILEKVLAVDFGKILTLSENAEGENRTLTALINGNKLLGLFGVEFALGDVTLDIDNNSVKASALGIDISLVAGGKVQQLTAAEKTAYIDLMPVLEALPDILEYKALSISGNVILTAGDTNVQLNINRGVISFANGIEAYLDISLVMSELTLDLQLYVNTQRIQVALGTLGIELEFDDLSHLGEAVFSLYEEVRNTVNSVSEKELLPQIKAIDELFELLTAVLPAEQGANKETDGLGDLLSQITIANSKAKNGLFSVSVKGVTLDIVKTPKGFVGLEVAFSNDNLKVSGGIGTAVYTEEMPGLAPVDYLNGEDLEELLDYLAAVVHTLAENNINIKLGGTIGSDDIATYPNGKYQLEGEARIYSGDDTLIHLDLDNKGLWVDTDAYIYVDFQLIPQTDIDKGIYVKLFILDYDGSKENRGNKDGILDVFLSLSMRKNGVAEDPLTLYAPANELMPVIGSLVAFLGVDVDILNDYLLKPWLSVETVAQLRGLGENILLTIRNIMGGEPATQSEAGSQSGETDGALDLSKLISAFTVGKNQLELALDSKALFGKDGDPLTITIGKERGENGSRLTLLSVANVANSTVSVDVSYEDKGIIEPTFNGMIPMNGIASLLKTLAYSTTHLDNGKRDEGDVISGEEKQHNYVLNESFYINGTISIVLSVGGQFGGAKLNIRVIACSVTIDEDGIVGVNIRFAYSATKAEALVGIVKLPVINGDTVVDLTGKDNMVYIKRVQSTDADGQPLAKAITIYRAMPLKNFGNDIIAQMGFLFNFSDLVTKILNGVDMSSKDKTSEETDIGTTVSNILTSIDYTKKASGETWKIVLNGKALIDVLGEITVIIGSDSEGKIRTLEADTSLTVGSSLDMTLNAGFAFRNPCGVWDKGVTDESTDVANFLIEAMNDKLESVDWAATKFIEGEVTFYDFVLDGEIIKRQGIAFATGTDGTEKGTAYGSLVYPDLTPYDNIKGYTPDWVEKQYGKGEFPASGQILASYKGNTYTLTFEFDNGTKEILDYIYGDKSFVLPDGRTGDGRRVAYYVDAYGNEYRTAEDLMNLNLDGELTLYARYEEDLYTIFYMDDDGSVTEQTVLYGTTVRLPEREREGYLFMGWYSNDRLYAAGEEITVYGDVHLLAQWKEDADIHLVTIHSEQPYDGFTGHNGVFIKTYTYRGEAFNLDTLDDLDEYRFMGYYTERNGEGQKMTAISDLDGDITLYVWWKKRTVTFNICSDIKFLDSTMGTMVVAGESVTYYYREHTLKDNFELDNSYMPTLAGYQALALWHQTGDTWERVTNVENLDGEDIWVLWIKDIKVEITEFTWSEKLWGAYLGITIKGHTEGGEVFGTKSNEIFTAVNGTIDKIGGYAVVNENGTRDALDWGKEFAVDEKTGEFSKDLTSSKATSWNRVFGGVDIRIVFTCGGQQIVTASATYISQEIYTITFDRGDGTDPELVKNIHLGAPSKVSIEYDTNNGKVTQVFDCATYADELAREYGIVAAYEGYTGAWPHVALTGSQTISSGATANSYLVQFYSSIEVPGWEQYAENVWMYERMMKYNSVISIDANGQVDIYKVGFETVIWLPENIDIGTRKGHWLEPRIDENGAEFVVEYDPNTVVYHSTVNYTYNGVQYGEGNNYEERYTSTLKLLTPDSVSGYMFVGWFVYIEDSWQLVKTLSVTAEEMKVTVEALWIRTDVAVNITKAKRSNKSGIINVKYDYDIEAVLTGGELVGVPAAEFASTASVEYTFYAADGDNATSGNVMKSVTAKYGETAISPTFISHDSKNRAHVTATLTYTICGVTFTLEKHNARGWD